MRNFEEMYKTKRASDEEEEIDFEFRNLSKIVSPDDMNVLMYLKHKDYLRRRWDDKN